MSACCTPASGDAPVMGSAPPSGKWKTTT
jgi:IMP dehydrogenase